MARFFFRTFPHKNLSPKRCTLGKTWFWANYDFFIGVDSFPSILQGFIHVRWCRISSINSSSPASVQLITLIPENKSDAGPRGVGSSETSKILGYLMQPMVEQKTHDKQKIQVAIEIPIVKNPSRSNISLPRKSHQNLSNAVFSNLWIFPVFGCPVGG